MTTKSISRAAVAISISLLGTFAALAGSDQAPRLWYTQPAEKWTEALPIGNGRLGAMVFGGVTDERIQFNDDTLWKGKPHDYVRPGALEAFPEIRKLMADGKTEAAVLLIRSNFLSSPVRQMPYQPFGDLHFQFEGLKDITNYQRELNLDAAVARTTFTADGIAYTRAAFASFPDQAIVVRLSADKPGHISFKLNLTSPHVSARSQATTANNIGIAGRVQSDGLKFEAHAVVRTTGGTVRTNGDVITVDKADDATVLLVAATSFKNFQDISADPAERCAKYLADIGSKKYEAILTDHLADYRNLFRRVSLDLGHSPAADQPTNVRQMQTRVTGLQGDPALAALYFQYGRYLLISSSRPGSQPANLQGNWNELLDPPWESKWTLNINCEMNYWPAEVANLSECTGPLFDMIDDLAISGGRTAKEQYGCRGWVVHHNTDLWRGSAPINNIDGVWPTGGAWLCYHLWEHYLFTGDKTFLAHAYPAMKEASMFFVDYLVKEPKHGWLVTSPSFSPEEGGLTMGPTMDNQLIFALLSATIESARILDKDPDVVKQLVAVREQLPPNQIGKHGQLQEWLDDVDVPNNNHRHMSPLWALYPGADITAAQTNVYAAAKLLLKWRGDGSTGWSYAWRIPLWARVGDGDFAYRQLNGLLQKRTLPNLFDLCGPFQIDGNFGATAGIAEMLLQSQVRLPDDKNAWLIDLLPALPKAWPEGSVTGLCARGGFEVDLTWSKGQLKQAVLRSKLGGPCRVRCGSHNLELDTKPGGEYVMNDKLALTVNGK